MAASPHMTLAIFIIFLATTSPCLARARIVPGEQYSRVNDKSSIATTSHTSASSIMTTSTSLPQSMVQRLAVPSPPATEVDYPESSGYIPQGSVPSPGIGHHK
ncbi:hypothetical protein QOZ80_5AG0401820 [Eleusine coracana subsp. coracana]|nr:hypothetical protein QOZ80_5AG0401820 [Eleusine coracana subsp. coracana]